MYANIPDELKARPMWVCSHYNGAPIDPKTARAASVTSPDTWGTFEQAVNAGLPYIGIVLGEKDPYVVIDLDDKLENPAPSEERDRFEKIVTFFDSYTERSKSGRGYHVICKGELGPGRRRGHVEVYDRWRYVIMTGDIYLNQPIKDGHKHVEKLVSEMPQTGTYTLDPEADDGEVYSDAEILEMCLSASNAAKFESLCYGNWEQYFTSQSEADASFVTYLAYYSRSNAQCIRIFLASPLGKREKALRLDYQKRTLGKARIDQSEPIDTGELKRHASEVVYQAAQRNTAETETAADKGPQPQLRRPPGLVGDIADYIYRSSDRPVWVMSVVSALGLVAGIAGRQYNISKTGLNLYLVAIADTGRGKEDMAKGRDRIIAALRDRAPTVNDYIGPASFASGQALVKALDDQDTMLATVGEAGLWMQSMTGRNANDAKITLKRALLDLYTKSGWGQALRSSVYSDKEKNTKTVYSPALSLVGDSTPKSFYSALDESLVLDGLMPRFMIIEYDGPRVRRNRNAGFAPEPELLDMMGQLVAAVGAMHANNTCQEIGYQPEALELLDKFDETCDDRINATTGAPAELWNRAHLKALKLSGLLAVGVNYNAPIVTLECAQWAVDLVTSEATRISDRFTHNAVGEGEHTHEHIMREYVERLLQTNPERRQSSHKVPKAMSVDPVVPFSAIRNYCRQKADFKNDRRGLERAIRDSLKALVDADVLVELAPGDVKAKYGASVRQVVYGIGSNW